MKSLHDQIAHCCIHFTGIGKDTCAAGFSYEAVDASLKLPYRVGLPCLKPDAKGLETLNGRPQCQCPKLQFPTEDEVQAELDSHKASMQKMALALAVIDPIRKEQKGKNWGGVLECPVCKGRLHVSHAAYNGHVHARCETADCVSWME
jgi:hypothetical protein